MRYGGTDKDERNGKVILTAVTWSGLALMGVFACVLSGAPASGSIPSGATPSAIRSHRTCTAAALDW